MRLFELFEGVNLLENPNAPLTKGASRVLADKRLVSGVADQLKSDHTLSPKEGRAIRRMTDEQATEWFVRELDKLEEEGIDGMRYGRDGQFHYWVANNYANGADIWEDITGKLPEALRDFSILKNRNALDANHNDIQKFKGVQALARYMLYHYNDVLEDVRMSAQVAALMKTARSVKIVDNEDYRIYLLQNRGAACAFGRGATYCTANTRNDYHWKAYSGQTGKGGAIFGIIPKDAEDTTIKLPDGRKIQTKEKYQIDGPSKSFKEPGDSDMPPDVIKEKFPYLWSDLVKGLNDNRQEIENPRSEDDPKNLELLAYNVDQEIQKLKNGLRRYWTDQVRPEQPGVLDNE